jgi:glycosyltransferase involved in cell wall biosynthesis
MFSSRKLVKMSKINLLYVRFAFPMPDEPGPKRPLEIAEYMAALGYNISTITSAGNFMTGNSSSPRSWRLFHHARRGKVSYIYTYALPEYRKSMTRRLLNYAVFTVLAILGGLSAKRIVNSETIVFVDISPPFAALGGYLLHRFMKRSRLVLEITDLPESAFAIGMFTTVWMKKVIIGVFRHIYRRSDMIVALTPGARRHIISQGIDPGRVKVVTNWISDSAVEDDRASGRSRVREKHNLGDKFVVMYTGGLGQAYDIMTWLRAAEKLRKYPHILCVLVGSGEKKQEYADFCRKRSLDNVLFIDPVPRRELGDYLAAADACINLFYPGDFWGMVIGHKIIDYLEAGRPVLFSGVGDTADIIEDAGAGIVVSPGDAEGLAKAMVQLAANPEKAREMGQNGARYLQGRYSKQSRLDRLRYIFERSVSREVQDSQR